MKGKEDNVNNKHFFKEYTFKITNKGLEDQ